MSLHWGIISAGLICQDFCAALHTLDQNDHKIVAVGARNIEDAASFAAKYKVERYYGSYDKVYEDEKVNIVYIGNLNNKHKEECIKALQHGKHILCEKPMCLNSSEQEEILSLAKSKGLFFMEAIWTRFFPATQRLREEIASGSIGELRIANCVFALNIRDNERVRNKELGGGGILDIGIYTIQFACLLFNHEEPIEIKAVGHLMSTGVDECCSITLKYSNQRLAVLTITTNAGMAGSLTVIGEKGVLQIPEFFWSPTSLTLANGEKVTYPIENSENCKTNFFHSAGLRYEAEAVRQAINQGLKEHPFVTHDNSRLIMKIMEEARKQLGYN